MRDPTQTCNSMVCVNFPICIEPGTTAQAEKSGPSSGTCICWDNDDNEHHNREEPLTQEHFIVRQHIIVIAVKNTDVTHSQYAINHLLHNKIVSRISFSEGLNCAIKQSPSENIGEVKESPTHSSKDIDVIHNVNVLKL